MRHTPDADDVNRMISRAIQPLIERLAQIEAELLARRSAEASRIAEWLLRRHQQAVEAGNDHVKWQRWAAELIRGCYPHQMADSLSTESK